MVLRGIRFDPVLNIGIWDFEFVCDLGLGIYSVVRLILRGMSILSVVRTRPPHTLLVAGQLLATFCELATSCAPNLPMYS